MGSATFSSTLTFTPPASGPVAQAFGVSFSYSAVSMGTLDVAQGSTTAVDVPFGGSTDARGIAVRNNLDVDVGVQINANGTDLYEIAPGGLFMHWAPVAAGTTSLSALLLTPAGAGPTADGTIEYVVLGS